MELTSYWGRRDKMSSLLSIYRSPDQGHVYNMYSNLPATKAFLRKIAPAQNIFFFFASINFGSL